MSLIPEIPFSSIINNNDKSIDILKKALTSHGFFSITGHSLSNDLVDHCYKSSQEFFKLNIETKLQYHDKKLKGARGYTPNGIETALGENIPDQKEFWHHGPIVDDSFDQRVSKNLFINEVVDFNKNYDNLFNELNQIGSQLLSAIALTLNLDSNYFNNWINKGNSLLRSIHYPAVISGNNQYRARAHEDINLITLLIGAEEGGLEILNNDGRWIKVNPSSNAIVCNIGDMLQLVTGNKLKSTTHRVMNYENHGNKSRYSIPFFLHPSPNTLLKSIYDHADEGVLANDFLEERLKAIKLY